MRRFFLIASAIFIINVSAFSQIIDSLSTNPNALSEWYTGEIVPKRKFKAAAFVAPVVLIGYGFFAAYDNGPIKQLDYSTWEELQEHHPRFAARVDDYLQYLPGAAVYALNFSGVKGKHNLFDASMLYGISAAIMGISTRLVKQGVSRIRPNGRGNNSFPSGHTAMAFMAAEFLHQEYKEVNPWIGYAGFFVASATGALRMYNNKHWFSDVVAGAGFGIASTKISYLVYPYIKRLFTSTEKKQQIAIMPFYSLESTGLMLSSRF